MECATDDDCLALNSMCVANTSWAQDLLESGALHTVDWAGQPGCSCSSSFGIVYNPVEASCSSSVPLIKLYAVLTIIVTAVTSTLLFLVIYDLARLVRLGTHMTGPSVAVSLLMGVSLISVALECYILLSPLEYDVSMDAFLANERPRASTSKLTNVHFATLFFLCFCFIVCAAEMCLVIAETAHRGSESYHSKKVRNRWHASLKTVRRAQVVLSILTPPAVITMSTRGGLVPYHVADIVLFCFILVALSFVIIVFVVYHVSMRNLTARTIKALEYNKRRGMQQEERARVIKSMSSSRGDRNFLFSGISLSIVAITLLAVHNNRQPFKTDGNTVPPSESIYAYIPSFIFLLRVGLFLMLLSYFRYTRRINSKMISAQTNVHVRKVKEHIVRKYQRSHEHSKEGGKSTSKTTSNFTRSSAANCTSGATIGVVGVDVASDSQRWEPAFSSLVDSLGQ